MKNLILLVVVLGSACGGKSESKDPIDQLIATEMRCKWESHDSFDESAKKVFKKSYTENKDKPGMKAALGCLPDKDDCNKFNVCRDVAAGMEGGR